MPTQSWKNLDPETGVHGEVDEKDWPLIRENWPAYDKKLTPTKTMGAVAEMFRQWPGSVRSDHPARSICEWRIRRASNPRLPEKAKMPVRASAVRAAPRG